MAKRIIIHWTAGTNQPNNIEYQHYHFLVNGDGLIIKGQYSVLDNENCTDGKYAQHCGGGNTGAIGIALCGMKDFNGKSNSTKYPLTRKQFEACMKKVAELCKMYAIRITPDTVMTHYEFGQKHPKTTSFGKIDITWIPYSEEEIKKATGDDKVTNASYGKFIRNKVNWYYERL